ncbi:PstS family phosphate ABC transporter substrate-binding protein [Atrimonas thermophila]|uniref:PstS family phosphate ABC transporter substrate-binding protein n=1 Tax=Atrimonas thermophila TaxID=3064161 RepID=UPI00399D0DFA
MKRFFLVLTLLLSAFLSLQVATAADKIVSIDGSSTIYPITEAVAEEFQMENRNIKVVVGISGTGGGFKRFCRGEIDINDASRPIKASEIELCKENGIEYIELPIAFDGIAVVVNPGNDWVDYLTVEELKKIWEPEAQGKVLYWSDIRPEWPKGKITLFGPGVDSGTFDYFTEAIVGEAGASRGDFIASEDDNVLVQGVSRDKYALGYFGFAYYLENQDVLKVVPIDDGVAENGEGPIEPTFETISKGLYQPLSRPLFIYVNKASADREEVRKFVRFYLENAKWLVEEIGYVALPDSVYELALKRFEERKTGTVFGSQGAKVGVSIEELLQMEGE